LETFPIPIFHPGKGTDPWVGREVGGNHVLGCACTRQTCIALIACSIDKSMSMMLDSIAFWTGPLRRLSHKSLSHRKVDSNDFND
jgi:hypothetical protein